MPTFEAKIEYAGHPVKIVTDDFAELHAALAGVEELNRDADFLLREKGAGGVVAVYREDDDENKYFGLQDADARQNVTYGSKRGESLIPFFPKGEDGYYDPDASSKSGGGTRGNDAQSNDDDTGEAHQQVMQRVQQLGRDLFGKSWKQRWKQTQEHYGRRVLTLDQLEAVHRRLMKRQEESGASGRDGSDQVDEPKGRAVRQQREELPY